MKKLIAAVVSIVFLSVLVTHLFSAQQVVMTYKVYGATTNCTCKILVGGCVDDPNDLPRVDGTNIYVSAIGHNYQIYVFFDKSFQLRWPAQTNAEYQVQYSTNLTRWITHPVVYKSYGSTNMAVDFPMTNAMEYFRVISL